MRNSMILLFFLSQTTPAFAQTTIYTDLEQSVSQVINTAGPLPVTVHYQVPGPVYTVCVPMPGPPGIGLGHHCFPQHPMVPATRVDQIIPTFSNVTVSFPDPPTVGATTYTNFPDQFIESTQDSQNCSSYANTIPMVLTLNATRSDSVTISKSVTHSQGITVGASGSAFGIGVSASVNVSNSSTSGTATSTGLTGGYSISGGGTITIPPKSRVVAFFKAYKIEGTIPFSVKGTFDANISSNDKGYVKLSDYVDPAHRTVEIVGTITSDDNSKGQFTSADGVYDPSLCPPGAVTVTNQQPNLAGLKLTQSKITVDKAVIQ